MKSSKYILWLPSWYPNELDPYNGDFIQRHAQATSLFCAITVIHFTQFGERVEQASTYETTITDNQLKEIISYVAFKPSGINLADKFRYNMLFYRNAKRYLAAYFKEFGLPEVVHVHVPMKAGNLALWIKKKYGINFLVSEQSSYYLKAAPRNYFERHLLYRKQVNSIFKKASIVTNVSAAIGQVLYDLFQLKKIVTIHNVVNTDYFTFSKEKNDVFTYVHVSTLGDQKNIKGILRTFEKLKSLNSDWQLLLVGPYTNDLVILISDLCLQNQVKLVGEATYRQVATYLKSAHVKVMFSKHENFPCVVVEALCCGLPVVASDVAGIREAVDPSNGILVTSENEAQLLTALLKIRENFNAYNVEAISKNAIEKYNYKVIGRQIFNLYAHISRS